MLLTAIIESSNDAITSASMDDRTFTSWNPAAERMYGYLAEEIIGQPISCLIPPENTHEDADNLSNIRGGYKIEPYETTRIRKNGSSISISLTISPIYDENGAVIGSSAIARDLTQEKRASQNARNMASIIESSNDAIVSASMDSIVISWNAAAERMYGYSAKEIVGQSYSCLIPPENVDAMNKLRKKIRDGLEVKPYETVQIRKDGSAIPVLMTISPIYDENGAVIGGSSITRDVTEQRQASQNARNMASIIESSNDAIMSASLQGLFTSWNTAAERMYGYLAEEMIGQPVSRLIPPEDTHAVADILSNIRNGYKIESYETLLIRKDGSSIPISLTISPIHDESGLVIGASGIARDITEQRQASQNARNAASIIESSNDAITSAGMDAIITSWNAAAERMYGYLAKEIIGQPISLIIPPEKIQEHIHIHSNIRDGYKIEPYETLRIRKDGSSFPISLTLSPIYDENGVIIGSSAITRDLTQEKEASQNARNAASIIESSNDAITGASLEGIFTSWNSAAERMYGYLAKEMIGQPRSLIIPPENTHEFAENLSKIRDGYQIEHFETLRIRKDGSTIPISLTVSPIYDESGAVIGSSGIARDITERRQAQGEILQLNASLVAADKVKDEFIENMNHELRTPLTSIVGYIDLAIDDVDAGSFVDMASSLSVMQRSALRLKILVENMMQLSKADFKYEPLNIATVDVGNTLGDLIKSLRPTAQDCKVGLTLQLDAPEGGLIIDGDTQQLGQMFLNLISNAIKFTPSNGTVTVLASCSHTKSDVLEVKVIDTGIGIPREEFPKIFQRFFRASTAIEASIPGFGIGLSLVASIVRGHHGTITFDSTVGEGTEFTVRVPVRYKSSRQVDKTT